MSAEPAGLSPTPDEARRHLDRLADRLRVMGPRLAGRDSPEAAALLADVRAGLQRLADLAASRAGHPARVVPELGVNALADQALVLGNDLLGTGTGTGTGTGVEPARPADRFRSEAVAAIDAVYALL